MGGSCIQSIMDSAKTDKVMLMGNGDYAAWKNYLEGTR
jgi:hypothetical protein